MGFGLNTSQSGGTSQGSLTTQPWQQQQPFLADIYGQSRDLYNRGGTPYYPGATYTSFNPLQEQAFGHIQGQAGGTDNERGLGNALPGFFNQVFNPNSFSGGSRAQLNATARGDYLGGNPYIDQTFDRAANAITRQYNNVTQPRSNLAFSRAGRSGSGLQALQDEKNFSDYVKNQSDLATDLYGGNYAQERQNQLGAAQTGVGQGIDLAKWAASQVPIHSALLDNRTDRLLGAGQQVQDQQQRILDDDIARFNWTQAQPRQNLSQYAQLILGQLANQTQSQQSSSSYGNSFGASLS